MTEYAQWWSAYSALKGLRILQLPCDKPVRKKINGSNIESGIWNGAIDLMVKRVCTIFVKPKARNQKQRSFNVQHQCCHVSRWAAILPRNLFPWSGRWNKDNYILHFIWETKQQATGWLVHTCKLHLTIHLYRTVYNQIVLIIPFKLLVWFWVLPVTLEMILMSWEQYTQPVKHVFYSTDLVQCSKTRKTERLQFYKKSECPLEGKCLQSNVVYQGTATTNTTTKSYVILASNFKEHYGNHKTSFRLNNR